MDEADRLNQEILASSPRDPQSLLVRGRLLLAQGKTREALNEIQESLKEEPKLAAGHYFLGVAQSALGDSAQAKSAWARALELRPRMPQAQLRIAEASLRNRDFPEAMRYAEEAAEVQSRADGSACCPCQCISIARGNEKSGRGNKNRPGTRAGLTRGPRNTF